MNEVSNLFVCLMGMGTTFVGLICIIFLTMLMGKVMQKLEKPEPPKAAPAPAAPAVPADGLTAEVKIAILRGAAAGARLRSGPRELDRHPQDLSGRTHPYITPT